MSRPPLVLINGLASQAETWSRNVDAWRRHFDVHAPELLAYDGPALQRRMEAGEAVDVAYLVEEWREHLERVVRRPPYRVVANSLGGKIAIEYAVRYPEQVERLVLLCPSGLSAREELPVVKAVKRSDVAGLVESVFHDRRHADRGIVEHYRQRLADRRWRAGLVRILRGTMGHRVDHLLERVMQPTLFVVGAEDRIVNPGETREAGRRLRRGRVVVLRWCGHAPQIEKARLVNRLVVRFLNGSLVAREARFAEQS
jgi:pimeloyl-ACP methyl ester carboxylesterase